MAQGPCLNPNCLANGQPHPNCKCYSQMAHGGEVHCNGPHKSECVYHLAEGGQPQQPEDPESSLTNSIVHHGLSGVFASLGRTDLAKFEDKHLDPLHHARENFTPVNVDSGHPLVGQIPKHEREHVLKTLSPKVMTTEPNAAGFRSASDHLKSSLRGKNLLDSAVQSVFKKGSFKLENTDTKPLQEQLEDLQQNPAKALEIGGSLGHYLPEQTSQFAAMTASAMSYFQSIKPMNTDMGPLSNPVKANKQSMEMYDRQLEIAQQPLVVLKRVKDGSLIPEDVNTLKTVYPKMYSEIAGKIGEQLISIKADHLDFNIPYSKKLALSTLLGQPMDASLKMSSLKAIMIANAPKTPQQPQGKPSKRPTGPAITQMSKNADKYQTATQEAETKQK
jgi:hypothetical protein